MLPKYLTPFLIILAFLLPFVDQPQLSGVVVPVVVAMGKGALAPGSMSTATPCFKLKPSPTTTSPTFQAAWNDAEVLVPPPGSLGRTLSKLHERLGQIRDTVHSALNNGKDNGDDLNLDHGKADRVKAFIQHISRRSSQIIANISLVLEASAARRGFTLSVFKTWRKPVVPAQPTCAVPPLELPYWPLLWYAIDIQRSPRPSDNNVKATISTPFDDAADNKREWTARDDLKNLLVHLAWLLALLIIALYPFILYRRIQSTFLRSRTVTRRTPRRRHYRRRPLAVAPRLPTIPEEEHIPADTVIDVPSSTLTSQPSTRLPSVHDVDDDDAAVLLSECFAAATTQPVFDMEEVELYVPQARLPLTLDRFTKVRPLGQGSFGSVNEVDCGGRRFAMKTLDLNRINPFYPIREYNMMRHIQQYHPMTSRLRAAYHDPAKNEINLVMDCLSGDLCSLIEGRSQNIDLRRQGAQLIDAVLRLHALQIVHCDLKSENILVDADGNIYLGDLGLSLYLELDAFGLPVPMTWGAGTPGWMADECTTRQETGPAGDVFSLAGILWHLYGGTINPYEFRTNFDGTLYPAWVYDINVAFAQDTSNPILATLHRMVDRDPLTRISIRDVKRVWTIIYNMTPEEWATIHPALAENLQPDPAVPPFQRVSTVEEVHWADMTTFWSHYLPQAG